MGQARDSLSQTLVFHLSLEGQRVDGAGNWRPFQEHVLRTYWNISSRRSGNLKPELRETCARKFAPFLLQWLTKVETDSRFHGFCRVTPEQPSRLRSSSISAKFPLVSCSPSSHDFRILVLLFFSFLRILSSFLLPIFSFRSWGEVYWLKKIAAGMIYFCRWLPRNEKFLFSLMKGIMVIEENFVIMWLL